MSFKEVDIVKPIPEGYHTVTPFLVSDNAPELISFIEKAFGGDVTYMMKTDEGEVTHSVMKIGDSLVMIGGSNERFKATSCMLHLYVDDVDNIYKKAITAGGISIREPRDEFYGDRSGGITDKWGNQWWIATHVENVDDEEIKRRERELRESQQSV